jgi:hypothetical protein
VQLSINDYLPKEEQITLKNPGAKGKKKYGLECHFCNHTWLTNTEPDHGLLVEECPKCRHMEGLWWELSKEEWKAQKPNRQKAVDRLKDLKMKIRERRA